MASTIDCGLDRQLFPKRRKNFLPSEMSEIRALSDEIRTFAQAGDWEQCPTPKNLLTTVAGEAGELATELQSFTPEEADPQALSAEKRRSLMFGNADVHNHLLRLVLVFNIGVASTVWKELAINESRF